MAEATREHSELLENNSARVTSSSSLRNSEASVHTVPSLEAAEVLFSQEPSSEQSTKTLSSMSQLSSINLSLLSLEAASQQVLQLQSSQALSQSSHSSSSFQSMESSPEILGSDNLIKKKHNRHHTEHAKQSTKIKINNRIDRKATKRRRKENGNSNDISLQNVVDNQMDAKETNGVMLTNQIREHSKSSLNRKRTDGKEKTHKLNQSKLTSKTIIKPLEDKEQNKKENENSDQNEEITVCNSCTSTPFVASTEPSSSLLVKNEYTEETHPLLMTDAQPTHLYEDNNISSNSYSLTAIQQDTMTCTGPNTSNTNVVCNHANGVQEENINVNEGSKARIAIIIHDSATYSESYASTHDTASSQALSTLHTHEINNNNNKDNKDNGCYCISNTKHVTVSTGSADTRLAHTEQKAHVEDLAVNMSPEHIMNSLNAHIELMSQHSSLSIDSDSMPFVERNVPVRSIHYIHNSQGSLFEIASSLLHRDDDDDDEMEHDNSDSNHNVKEPEDKHKHKRKLEEEHEHKRKKHKQEKEYKNSYVDNKNERNEGDVEENTPLLELFPLSHEESSVMQANTEDEEDIKAEYIDKRETLLRETKHVSGSANAEQTTENNNDEILVNEEEVKQKTDAAPFTENDECADNSESDNDDFELELKKLKCESAHITHHGSTSCLFLVLPPSSSYTSQTQIEYEFECSEHCHEYTYKKQSVETRTQEQIRKARKNNLCEWLHKWEPILVAWSQQTLQRSNDILSANAEYKINTNNNVSEINNNDSAVESSSSSSKHTKRVIICVVETLEDMYDVLLAYSSHVRALHAQLLPIFVVVAQTIQCNYNNNETTREDHECDLHNQWRLLKYVQSEFDLDLKNSFALMCTHEKNSKNYNFIHRTNLLWSYFLRRTRVFSMTQCNKLISFLKTHTLTNEESNYINAWHELVFDDLCQWNALARELCRRACRPAIVIKHTSLQEEHVINKLDVLCGLVRPAVCHAELFIPTTSRERRLFAMQESSMVEYLPCVYTQFHHLLCEFFTSAVYYTAVNVVHTHGDDYFSGYSCQAVGFLQFEVSCLVRRYVKVQVNINLQVLLDKRHCCNTSNSTVTNVRKEEEQQQQQHQKKEQVANDSSSESDNNAIINSEVRNNWQSLLPEFACSCTPRNHERVLYTSDGRKKCRHVAELLYYFIQRQRYARNATLEAVNEQHVRIPLQ